MAFLRELLDRIIGAGSKEGGGRSPAAKGSGGDEGLYFYVKLSQTGEVVELRLIPKQELVPDYKNGGYFTHKVITGPRTLGRADALFRFDDSRKFVDAEIQGGELSDAEAYRAQKQ
jgi:hypothetical protein